MITKKILTESYRYDSLIRSIVKDIIQIFKKENDGEFYLPEDSEENLGEYILKDVEVTVELILETTENIDGFLVDGEYYPEDDVIAIKIIYNPKEKQKLIYTLVGELNELIGHEIRHNYQRNKDMFELSDEVDDETGYEYYSKPHEVDAQYYGFKRMSKITRKPFEDLVKDWFRKNKQIHQMNDEDSEKVIQKILNFNP